MFGWRRPTDDLLGRTHGLPDGPDFVVIKVKIIDANGATGGDQKD